MNKIQLCNTIIIASAIRITDLYGTGDGLECISWDFGAGEGGGACEPFGEYENEGSGDGSGVNQWEDESGDGFGKSWGYINDE